MEDGGKDLKEKALRSLKQSLGRLWRRRSVTITEYDPCYKVSYLGNVLTGWAKGEGCVEKPLCTLWKNYQSSSKPDVHMKVTVTQSGLKALTKEHGLTEYWSHRITYCAAPSAFPKVFCWVYRHEGRKLKQELRCHAVLCSKESVAKRMAQELRTRLIQALTEFKKDKLSKQNARLSLANSVYDNPSMPRRRILLSTGSQNYRPPLERSKSAPKLMSIEESLEEDEEEVIRKSFRSKERFRLLSKVEEKEPEKESWVKERSHVPASLEFKEDPFPESLETPNEEKEKVDFRPEPQTPETPKEFLRLSWSGENSSDRLLDSDLSSDYGESVSTKSENDLSYRQDDVFSESNLDSLPSIESASEYMRSLMENRKKLLDSLLESEEAGFTEIYRDLDEESTPSLQSISSGSCGRPVNLDSLSEEESDESGFAEAADSASGPPSTSDDKVRDLPHHHLVKSCLATKTPCLHV